VDHIQVDLADSFRRQHGCVSRHQILDAGFTSRQIERRVASGLFVPVGRGVYRAVSARDTVEARLWAGHLEVPGSVVSHRSAASWFGFAEPPDRPELSIPMSARHAPAGCVVHRRRIDLAQRTITVDGLRLVRPEVTVFELAAYLSDTAFTLLVDRYLGGSRPRLDRLIEWFARVCGRGRAGTLRSRRELERRIGGDIAESRLERRFLDVIDASDLERPMLQWIPPWDPGIRVDAAFVDARLLIELDGQAFHSATCTFEIDRRRDQVAAAHGWMTLRFTWANLRDEPDSAIAVIRSALVTRTRLGAGK